jgi:hypothetical protein
LNPVKIAPDEMEDAFEALKAAGRDQSYFHFSAVESVPAAGGPVQQQITVTRSFPIKGGNKTQPNVIRVYPGGHGTNWPAAFAADLAAGVFP